ncbi:hypothetical protein RCCGEPOP_10276 [Rhizobium sp. Pop5]|nr:hypothetical protein RCCGEPOP_10276 [Rhizobium sp. Pop5]
MLRRAALLVRNSGSIAFDDDIEEAFRVCIRSFFILNSSLLNVPETPSIGAWAR